MQDSEHLRKAGDDARGRGTALGSGARTDAETAAAFASSWNHVGEGSVYKREDFVDWLRPIDPASIEGETVLEMGFGNGSQLFHMAAQRPKRLCGVELGDTLEQTRRNLAGLMHFVELHRGDLTTVDLGTFDLVYCIGVLHHLQDPERGFEAVLRHTRPGGRFHCWVYAREGNGVVIRVVEPVRRLACRLPWWLTKYGVALPMVAPYYAYAKALRMVSQVAGSRGEELAAKLPLGAYTMWISRREFPFFHHVAFDQLVTPQTHFLPRATLEKWLQRPEIDERSTYIIQRNGNSWNFGGRRRSSAR
jgi:SAM-dependent methyltransferase